MSAYIHYRVQTVLMPVFSVEKNWCKKSRKYDSVMKFDMFLFTNILDIERIKSSSAAMTSSDIHLNHLYAVGSLVPWCLLVLSSFDV
jgi:hypothetical protein